MEMHERSSNPLRPLLTFLFLGTTNCHYLRTDSYPSLHKCGKLFKQTTLATRLTHLSPIFMVVHSSYQLEIHMAFVVFRTYLTDLSDLIHGISIHLKTSMKTSFEITFCRSRMPTSCSPAVKAEYKELRENSSEAT